MEFIEKSRARSGKGQDQRKSPRQGERQGQRQTHGSSQRHSLPVRGRRGYETIPARDEKLYIPEIAAHVLAEVETRSGHASALLARSFRRHPELRHEERGAIAEIVYGVLRNRRWIDFLLGPENYHDALARARSRCRMFARLGDPQATQRLETVADPIERFAVRTSLPTWLATRFVEELGMERARALGMSMLESPPVTVRVDSSRITRDELLVLLRGEGFEVEPTRWARDGVQILSGPSLFRTAIFHDGLCEVQDEGSQLVSELTAPPPDGFVLDACAGAGGKTLHLGALLRGRGRVLALDVEAGARRTEELKRRVKRVGLTNVTCMIAPAEGPLPERLDRWIGKADRVLVDAPCSGTGVLRRNPESKDRLEPSMLERLPKLQREILERFAPFVRPGGRLVYSTCSLLAEENDRVVDAFLAAHPEFTPMTSDEIWGRERAIQLGDSGRLRLSPDTHGADGFFAAVMRRKKD